MGAIWLLTTRSDRGAELIRRTGIDRLPDAAQDAWAGASSGLQSGTRHIREATSDAADTIRRGGDKALERLSGTGQQFARAATDYVSDLPDRAGNLFDDARDSLAELFKSQPLAIGAVGLAVGAAIAAAFPATDIEGEYLGEGSEFVKQKASEIAGEQVERVTEIGKKVADAVVDEARQQGLTVEGLKSAATGLSDKAARVAEAATGRATPKSAVTSDFGTSQGFEGQRQR